MKPTYRIKDWDKHFENHESRKVKRSYWVAIPNRHDGKSYRRIAAHPDGVAVFSAWILILEAASKMPTRGVLADEDGPLDAEDLSAMTGFPAAIFDAAFNLLTQERFGWLSTQELKAGRRKSPAISRNLPQSPAASGTAAVELQGTTGNGRERNGTEGDGIGAQPRSRAELVHYVFDFWKTEMGHPKAQLTAERKRKIEERLDDSTVEEIEAAVRGCKASDFHMGREPGHPDKFDDIELICRKRSKLESFISKCPKPRAMSAPRMETVESRLRRESCERCHATGTEIIPGKGARVCDHGTGNSQSSNTVVECPPQDREARVS